MRLYTFEADGKARIGAEKARRLVDFSTAPIENGLPGDMLNFLRAGAPALDAARGVIAASSGEYALADVRILAPILYPGKILCSGINYRSHLDENPTAVLPQSPFFFSKLPSAVIGQGEPIIVPKNSQQVDYEVEFAVVFGSRAPRGTAPQAIMDHVFGYTLLHDVSARDVQFKDNQITLGKNFDTFCPLGPCLVTKDEMPDLGDVRLRSYLNGVVMQDGSSRDWVFTLTRLLTAITDVMTLEPGDIVTTGTPGGVGFFRNPQVFLKAGDVVAIEVEGIGRLENPVIADPL